MTILRGRARITYPEVKVSMAPKFFKRLLALLRRIIKGAPVEERNCETAETLQEIGEILWVSLSNCRVL